MRTMYFCDCGKGFDSKKSCEAHEWECIDFVSKENEVLEKAKQMIFKEYGDQIVDVDYNVRKVENGTEGFAYLEFQLTIQMQNKSIINITNNTNNIKNYGGFVGLDELKPIIDKKIKSYLSYSYEGVVSTILEDSWYYTYLGDIKVEDILSRLEGRRVKLELIEEGI